MTTDRAAYLRGDRLAVAMRDLGYSLAAIDEAIERAAMVEFDAHGDVAGAERVARHVVDWWPLARRMHQASAPVAAA